MLEFDLTDLLCAFSELLPLTNEELGQYWFRYNRVDGATIQLALSAYENHVGLILRRGEVDLVYLSLSQCRSLRVTGNPPHYAIEVVGSRNNPDARCSVRLEGTMELQFFDAPPR